MGSLLLDSITKEVVMIMSMKKTASVILSAVILILSCGCGASSQQNSEAPEIPAKQDITSCTKELFAMDTYMTVTAYGEKAEKAVGEALSEIQRLDALLSTENTESEISLLNKKGSAKLSEDSTYLYEKAKYIYDTTGGAYDITIYPLMKLWGFDGGEPSLPEDSEIKAVLANIGSDRLKYSDGTLTLGQSQGIDLGGIAKGYTSGRIMQIFEENDISSGVVSLGGNVQCYKKKPDGSLWRCGITDPDNPDDTSSLIGKVEVEDKAVITSGGYERFFTDEKSGVTYHHIMDPETGYSAKSGLKSVSIVSSDGTLADGLSTACFVLGREKALKYWENHRKECDMILVTDDGEVIVTSGISGAFSSDRDFTVYNGSR